MKIKIGTRKSRLALAQTELVCAELKKAFPEAEIEVVHISTRGDRITDRLKKSAGAAFLSRKLNSFCLTVKLISPFTAPRICLYSLRRV